MRKPVLSDESFLAFLFHPKKHSQPAGIRKTTLVGVKGGRSKSRLRAFNRMPAASQETLRRAGLRESYLKGESTLADAKRKLRPQAIALNVAKPVRARGSRHVPLSGLKQIIAAHIKQTLRSDGRIVVDDTVDDENEFLENPEIAMTSWSSAQIRHAGREGSGYDVYVGGKRHNPFFYH